jgi:uncharacterized protein (DUF4415 family)
MSPCRTTKRRASPHKSRPLITLWLDPEVVAHYRRTGRGWQSRINALLRKAAKLPKEKKRA